MRMIRVSFFCWFIGTLFLCPVGCGSSTEPSMEPRTEAEIQAYKDEVYGAEEADSAAAEEE